jgi:hypothetical protein
VIDQSRSEKVESMNTYVKINTLGEIPNHLCRSDSPMATAYVYRRALRRFATSLLYSIVNVVVCALMIRWVSQREVSPMILSAILPLILTLWNMWRCTAKDLKWVGAAISGYDAARAELTPAWATEPEAMELCLTQAD